MRVWASSDAAATGIPGGGSLLSSLGPTAAAPRPQQQRGGGGGSALAGDSGGPAFLAEAARQLPGAIPGIPQLLATEGSSPLPPGLDAAAAWGQPPAAAAARPPPPPHLAAPLPSSPMHPVPSSSSLSAAVHTSHQAAPGALGGGSGGVRGLLPAPDLAIAEHGGYLLLPAPLGIGVKTWALRLPAGPTDALFTRDAGRAALGAKLPVEWLRRGRAGGGLEVLGQVAGAELKQSAGKADTYK
jgi:hypothetical protein